jgi:hypothetical protein
MMVTPTANVQFGLYDTDIYSKMRTSYASIMKSPSLRSTNMGPCVITLLYRGRQGLFTLLMTRALRFQWIFLGKVRN